MWKGVKKISCHLTFHNITSHISTKRLHTNVAECNKQFQNNQWNYEHHMKTHVTKNSIDKEQSKPKNKQKEKDYKCELCR